MIPICSTQSHISFLVQSVTEKALQQQDFGLVSIVVFIFLSIASTPGWLVCFLSFLF